MAAVFNPLMLKPSLIITPPPRKPIPDMTYEANLACSFAESCMAKDKNKNEPIQTKTFVTTADILCRSCLSKPIINPQRKAINSRWMNISIGIGTSVNITFFIIIIILL